ncbi:supervillin [Entelurus aequoreus]|uniref:supervillin n=1 Tax=Entelurus aequoreus TaxID=161455 RepID=UPI002B1E5EEC|nr:supervillin [Entelurus aequoreus]
MEELVLEPRSERIARYKAERRRELAERFGNMEDLTPQRVNREVTDPRSHGQEVNGKMHRVQNGSDPLSESTGSTGKGSQDCANMPGGEGHQVQQLHTRVSVGQLRSALLQQAESGEETSDKACADDGRATSSLDLAVKPASDGAHRRRTRRYFPGGSSGTRKNNERFRTQPITANEMEHTSGPVDAEEEKSEADVKTDERAQMSVAAKMSLFKEMEKTSAPEASAFLKPRSGSICHERRARRGNDHRFLTQPITCEEMVAISLPPAAPEVADPPQAEPSEGDDEGCKLSVSEKLALFNKLSLPETPRPAQGDGPPERRRQKGARYRTQPITVEEVTLLQKVPVQLPALCLSSQLSDKQQSSSVNLKPSELRLTQSKPDISPVQVPAAEQGMQRCDSEPGLRGILKRSRSERCRTTCANMDAPQKHNGAVPHGDGAGEARTDGPTSRRARREASGEDAGPLMAAPWRQRPRSRRETIAFMPARPLSLHLHQREETPHQRTPDTTTFLEHTERHNNDDVAAAPVNGSYEVQQMIISGKGENSHPEGVKPQCWEPVFSSVFSSSTPQYVMCFNQTNQSFEAQEVASPTKSPPLWREKVEEDNDNNGRSIEAEETRAIAAPELNRNQPSCNETQSTEASPCTLAVTSHSAPPSADNQEEMPPENGFCTRQTSLEGRDLDLLCQTNTPMLTSAVAEHRRAVRPSRRTQGSRNPLRALAAREDVRQDFMELNTSSEEAAVSEKKSKNSSSSSPDPQESHPPFTSPMLLFVKGRHHVQVRLAEPSASSLNSGDCFLLVTAENCILWSGKSANEKEKAKATELASFIQSHKGLGCQAARVVHLEEGCNCEGSLATDFWSVLGGRTSYREKLDGLWAAESSLEEDELYERGIVESNCVYRLLENRLIPHEQAWSSMPSVSLLKSSEALVFDFGSEVYLWLGKEVPASTRKVALQLSRQVWVGAYDYSNCRVNPLDPTRCSVSTQLRGEGRPGWALFGVLLEHKETCLFKEKFVDWTGRVEEEAVPLTNDTQTPSLLVAPPCDPLRPCNATALVSAEATDEGVTRTVLAGVDVQRGYGPVTLERGEHAELRTTGVATWHVNEFDDCEDPLESTGQLHEGDSYVFRWTYSLSTADEDEGKENTAFFLWRGRHSAVSGRDTAAFLSIGMNNNEESQVVVCQGKEPPCFLQLFQGGLVIHKGQRGIASAPTAEHVESWRLFSVQGELPDEGSLLEVECCCAALRSRGSLVLVNSQQRALYLWTGCKALASCREVAKRAVERLAQACPPELGLSSQSSPVKIQEIEEGSEPAEFWAVLVHMDRKAYDCMLQDPGKYNFTPRLFHLSASSGGFLAEELHSPSRLPGLVMAMPFVQETLYAAPPPALFLLDNCMEVYLWQRTHPVQEQGRADSWHSERKCAMETALQYCKEVNPRRPPLAYLILEGEEPLTFTNVFPRWERTVAQGSARRSKLTLVQDALAQLASTQFPLERLLQRPLPDGVDPRQLEVYLSDQDFKTILEMKREDFASLPSWQQADRKRNKGLLCQIDK